MATQMFKDGQEVWIDADKIARYKEAGWSFDEPGVPAPQHPDVILPAGLGLERLTPAEQEAAILEQMGIHNDEPVRQELAEDRIPQTYIESTTNIQDLSALSPEHAPKTHKAPAIKMVGNAEVKPKRQYTRKAAQA